MLSARELVGDAAVFNIAVWDLPPDECLNCGRPVTAVVARTVQGRGPYCPRCAPTTEEVAALSAPEPGEGR